MQEEGSPETRYPEFYRCLVTGYVKAACLLSNEIRLRTGRDTQPFHDFSDVAGASESLLKRAIGQMLTELEFLETDPKSFSPSEITRVVLSEVRDLVSTWIEGDQAKPSRHLRLVESSGS